MPKNDGPRRNGGAPSPARKRTTPTIEAVRAAALEWADAGASVLPVRGNGSKRPDGDWKAAQTSPATREDVAAQFAPSSRRTGVGIALGYNGYECLEFESRAARTAYGEVAEAVGLDALLQRVIDGYHEMTPGGGVHLIWRCTDPDAITGNTKLAADPDGKVIAETRGRGGFVILAPSHGDTHPTGRPYRVGRGSPGTVAEVTRSERERLLELAHSLDRSPPPPPRERPVRLADGTRPGDAYNRRAEWAELLEPEDWVKVYTTEDDVTHWRRPGKRLGTSATTNIHGSDLLYVFSSNAVPFEQDRSYDKFGAYAVLHHDGDHAAAAKELAEEGYGEDAERERFALVSPSELAKPAPHLSWLVKGVWPENSHGVLAGVKKSLKSWNALAFAVAVATGQPYLGKFDVRKRGPVLVFNGEGGEVPFRRRFHRICAAYGLDPADVEVPVYATFDIGSVDGKPFRDAMKRYLDAIQPVLVVLDPLYVYHPANIEAQNLYERGRMLGALSAEVGHGAGLLVVDHYRKTGGANLDLDEIGQAGMSQWANSWILQGHRSDPDLAAGTFRLNVEHGGRDWGGQRWAVDWECGEFDYEAGEPAGDVSWSIEPYDGPADGSRRRKLDHTELQTVVLAWVNTRGADTKDVITRAVAAENRVGDQRVRAAFEELERDGRLRSRKGKKPDRRGVARPADLWEPADARLRVRSTEGV